MAQKPNILILMTDQQRADCLSAAGHPTVRTPNMDRLAAEGTRFERCYTSCPVCMPARSTFASGLFSHNHGQWRNGGSLFEQNATYMKRMREAGYRTAHIGKSHLHPHTGGVHMHDRIPFMNALGFDDVIETTGPRATRRSESAMTDRWRELGILETYREDYNKRFEIAPVQATWPSPMPEGETADDFVGRTAVEYLQAYDRNEPFCLFVGFGGPHEPWDPPASWAEKYAEAQTPGVLPRSEAPAHLSEAARAYEEAIHDREIPPEEAQAIQRLYFAKIAHIDDWFGRILETLEEKSELEKTLILFWSDHGERLCDRGGLFKCVFYDESARVPLIVRRPDGAGGGQVSRALCGTADMTATLCEAAGVEPVGFGRSLLPATEDPGATVQDAVFSEIRHTGPRTTMVRTDRWKMVIDEEDRTLQLFDMEADPQEFRNLAGSGGHAEIERDLRLRILRWHLQTPTDLRVTIG